MERLTTLAIEGRSLGAPVYSFDLPLRAMLRLMRTQSLTEGLDPSKQTGINRALLESRLPNMARAYENALAAGMAIEHGAFVCVDVEKTIEVQAVLDEIEVKEVN